MAPRTAARAVRAAPTRRSAPAKPALKAVPVRRAPTAKPQQATRTVAPKRNVRTATKSAAAASQSGNDLTLAIARMRLEVYHQLRAQTGQKAGASGAPAETDAQVRTKAKQVVDCALGLEKTDTQEENSTAV